MSLCVGAVETTNNYVEHPQVVAERLVRAARCVGDRSRIVAATDCGFGTFAGDSFTAEDVGLGQARIPRRRRANRQPAALGPARVR